MVTHRLLKHSMCSEGQPSQQCMKGLAVAYGGICLLSETKSTFILSYCISTCSSIKGTEDRKTLLKFNSTHIVRSGLSLNKKNNP